jgi:hypothetical protein
MTNEDDADKDTNDEGRIFFLFFDFFELVTHLSFHQ